MPLPKSDVWKSFTKLSNNEASCNICGREIKTSGNTSNMRNHLKTHKVLIDSKETVGNYVPVRVTPKPSICTILEINQATPSTSELPRKHELTYVPEQDEAVPFKIHKKQASPSNNFNEECVPQPSIAYTDEEPAFCRITDALIQMITRDKLPLTVMEGIGFKRLLNEVVPIYKIPTLTIFKEHLNKKCNTLSTSLKNKLTEIDNMTLAINISTESVQANTYLEVSLHYLEHTKSVSCLLEIIEISESYTAKDIARCLQDVLTNWWIGLEKIVAVVSNNEPKTMKVVRELFDLNKHINCFGHNLNNVIEHALKKSKIMELLLKVRAIVKFIKLNASDEFKSEQMNQQINEDNLKTLILDTKAEWTTSFYMAERFLELSDTISNTLLARIGAPQMLSSLELDSLNEVANILRLLERMILESSKQKYLVASMLIPMINCLVQSLKTLQPKHSYGINLTAALETEINEKFGNIEEPHLLAITTLLDPRFKNLHFTSEKASAMALQHLNNLLVEVQSNPIEKSSNSLESELDFWSYHKLLIYEKYRNEADPHDTVDLAYELTMYLSSSVIQLKDNPLEAWEDMKEDYPDLYLLARKYFSIVSTSLPTDTLFARRGDATTNNPWNNLCIEMLQKLLFLNRLPEECW